jgi:hypothetical protein
MEVTEAAVAVPYEWGAKFRVPYEVGNFWPDEQLSAFQEDRAPWRW